MKKQVTMKDVADRANVSISTVSRVVSSSSLVRGVTADRIRKIIEETGYKPNASARALALSKTDVVGVYIGKSPGLSLANSYFIDVLEAIAMELELYQKDILLIFEDGKDNVKLKKIVESKQIDSVIMLTVKHEDEAVKYLKEASVDFVVIGNPLIEEVNSVDNDNVSAMRSITMKMIESGHSKIAFVGGTRDYIVTTDRQTGYERAMEEFGKNTACYYVEFSLEGGSKIAEELMEAGFTAAVCTDDLIAMGIKKYALTKDYDICVSGFNNTLLGRISGLIDATVEINSKRLGKEAVRILMNKSDGESVCKIVETQIIFIGENKWRY